MNTLSLPSRSPTSWPSHPSTSLPPHSIITPPTSPVPPSPSPPCLRCSPSSWAAAHGIPYRSSTAGQNYILSLYWASATLTSVGYGDVSASDEREMVFSLVVQLTGIMLYGYCLGVIAATLTNAASFRSA